MQGPQEQFFYSVWSLSFLCIPSNAWNIVPTQWINFKMFLFVPFTTFHPDFHFLISMPQLFLFVNIYLIYFLIPLFSTILNSILDFWGLFIRSWSHSHLGLVEINLYCSFLLFHVFFIISIFQWCMPAFL